MASGRDDLNWLYRDDDPERTHIAPTGNDEPTRQAPADPQGRQRSSFAEERTPRTASKPQPAPAPAPAPRPQPSATPRAKPAPPPRQAAPPAATRRTPKKPKRPVRTFFRLLTVMIVLWLAFLIGTPIYAWSATTKDDVMPTGARAPSQPGTLWLLVGSDSREGLSPEERKRLGTGDIEGQRTDTMLLLYVPPSGKPALISIPRDSYVPIPGHGRNKINAAYAFGGAPLLIETVEQNTGLKVDHYAEIGFGGFVNVIDALGGIEMCPKTAIKDRYSHLDIPAGCQEMDGVTALGYVRMRYADPLGDLGRMKRQREMIAGIVAKAATPATVLNPFRWWSLNTGAAQSLTTDRDTGSMSMAGLAGPLMQIGSGNGLTVMVPVSNPNARTSAGSSMIWDAEESKAMFSEIKRGDTSNLGRFSRLPGE